MTRDEIMRVAVKAGFEQQMRHVRPGTGILPDALFIRFAALVEARERAACFAACQAVEDGENGAAGLAWECVDAIRERAK